MVAVLLVGIISLFEYMAVVFAIGEVSFRMLDGRRHERSRGRARCRWCSFPRPGLWHLPISAEITWQSVSALLALHIPYGVCLSLFWRKTGNLVVPGLAHALGDAIRNAITVTV